MRKCSALVWTTLCLLVFCIGLAPAPAQTTTATLTADSDEAAADEPRDRGDGRSVVYRIELREDIMSGDVPFFIHRAVVAAKAAKADAIVLDLSTNGGSLGLMQQIRDDLLTLEMPSYAYINNKAISAGSLLALTMKKIVMSPISSIGGAQVITATGQQLPEQVEGKVNSILKADVRAAAKYRGHPVQLCEAFVDAGIVIPGLTDGDSVLTLDQDQATTETVYVDSETSKTVRIPPLAAYIAEDLEDLLRKDDLWPALILQYELSWSEKLAKWLMAIKAVLLLIGLGALFVEVKTPGVGVPGAIGVTALALFFWGSYVADLASVIEAVLFVVGFILLILEIFVIPGFGIAGVSGIFLILTSLIMAMIKLPPSDIPNLSVNTAIMSRAIWTLVVVFAAMIPITWALARILPGAPLFRNLILPPTQIDEADRREHETARPLGVSLVEKMSGETLVGKTGKAVTDLRPAGIASIDGRRVDVMTQGDYVMRGARVRVVDVHGNVLTVVPDEEQEPPAKSDEEGPGGGIA